MPRIKLIRTRKPKIPKLRLDRHAWGLVGDIAIGDMLERIDKQQAPDRRKLKRNAKSTRERKRRQGKPILALHDTGKRFHRPEGYKKKFMRRGRGVVVFPKDRKVAKYVTSMYPEHRTGYRWIGMSKAAWRAVRALIRKELRKQIKKARRG